MIVNLFSGADGWGEALRLLGVEDDYIGVEFNEAAAATAIAAGHATHVADLSMLCTSSFGRISLLIASPPCQAWSTAGKGLGKLDQPRIIAHIKRVKHAGRWLHYSREGWHDERSPLVLEPLRWALEQKPDAIALEQVPAVLPLWKLLLEVLADHGYHGEAAVLSAEQYGVPQTRKRAIMSARLRADHDVQAQAIKLPAPTHQAYRKGRPIDTSPEALPRWVSMAEALEWGMTERPSMTVTGGGTETGGAEPFGNGARKSIRAERDAGRWRSAA